MSKNTAGPERYLPGWIYRSTHQAAVDAILTPLDIKRKVISEGNEFCNRDRFTVNFFIGHMVEWARDNPGKRPMRSDVSKWVEKANNGKIEVDGKPCDPHIRIASTPNKLSKRKADALRGGAYHEALHTAYDVRDNLSIEETWPLVNENWDLVPNWWDFAETLLFWDNELKDVKNEERGNEEYMGITPFLHAIHDARAESEKKGTEKLKARTSYVPNIHSVVISIFRRLAFGYDTDRQKTILEECEEEIPGIVDFVHDNMMDLFKQANRQWKMPRTSSLDLAMKIVGRLYEHSHLSSDLMLLSIIRKQMKMQRWGHCRVHWCSTLQGSLKNINMPPNPNSIEHVLASIVKEAVIKESESHQIVSYSPEHDEIVFPKSDNKAADRSESLERTKEMRRDISFYRSRMRTRLKAQVIRKTRHNRPSGIDLSEESLVETIIDIRRGEYPEKAYYTKGPKLDVNAALYTLWDLSGSMYSVERDASKVCLSIVDPMTSLGCKTMCSGFQTGKMNENALYKWHENPDLQKRFHRIEAVRHIILKTWDEPLHQVRYRFACAKADGMTPMADGIQFALNALEERNENNKILIVVTDGWPSGGREIITRQLDDARRSGSPIIIGVGFGRNAEYVGELFGEDLHVWGRTVHDIPQLLVKKLDSLMDFRGRLRKSG